MLCAERKAFTDLYFYLFHFCITFVLFVFFVVNISPVFPLCLRVFVRDIPCLYDFSFSTFNFLFSIVCASEFCLLCNFLPTLSFSGCACVWREQYASERRLSAAFPLLSGGLFFPALFRIPDSDRPVQPPSCFFFFRRSSG